jgi:hypothetical protein
MGQDEDVKEKEELLIKTKQKVLFILKNSKVLKFSRY